MASASFTALTSIALLLMVVHSAHLQSLADQHPSKSAQEVLRVAAIEVADEVSATCMVLDLVTPRTGLLAFAGAVALMLYALAGSDFRTTAATCARVTARPPPPTRSQALLGVFLI